MNNLRLVENNSTGMLITSSNLAVKRHPMEYEVIRNKPGQFQALTSLSIAQFDALLPVFALLLEARLEARTIQGRFRQRRFSPRNEAVLPTDAHKLFFILIYLKNNPLQEYHAAAFGLTQDWCNRWIHLLLPLVNKALAKHQANESVSPPAATGILVMDATERPVERDTYEQAHFYSGKKKLIR